MIDLTIIDVSNNTYLFNNLFFLDNQIPGPNAYKNNSLIGCNIFNSRYKSPCFISLSKKFKVRDRNEGNPGPGSYIRFSEFGILAPKKEMNKKQNEKEEEMNIKYNEEKNYNLEENKQKNNIDNYNTLIGKGEENNLNNENQKENNNEDNKIIENV